MHTNMHLSSLPYLEPFRLLLFLYICHPPEYLRPISAPDFAVFFDYIPLNLIIWYFLCLTLSGFNFISQPLNFLKVLLYGSKFLSSQLVPMLKPVLRAFLRSAKLFTFPFVVHIVPAFNLDCSIKWG